MENYNIILDTIDISSGSSVTEPVSLDDIKLYLRLQGFIDDNDSTAIPEFTDDDEILEELITTARAALEEKLQVSIIIHTWRGVGVTNIAGKVQLKYGPVIAIVAALKENSDAYDETDTNIVKAIGDYLLRPCSCDMTIDYTAGYNSVPSPLITEIKRMVAYLYEHRGDETGLDNYIYTGHTLKYSRRSLIE